MHKADRRLHPRQAILMPSRRSESASVAQCLRPAWPEMRVSVGLAKRTSVALKRDLVGAVMAGRGPDTLALRNGRVGRATILIALRQFAATEPLSLTMIAWLAAYGTRAWQGRV